jgi:hypothetical protein
MPHTLTICKLHAPAELVKQLLAVGASVSDPGEKGRWLQPLHLACMGRIRNKEQVRGCHGRHAVIFTLLQAMCSLLLRMPTAHF